MSGLRVVDLSLPCGLRRADHRLTLRLGHSSFIRRFGLRIRDMFGRNPIGNGPCQTLSLTAQLAGLGTQRQESTWRPTPTNTATASPVTKVCGSSPAPI